MKTFLSTIISRWRRDAIYPTICTDDIFLVSFPKSGNTWVSFLLANAMCLYAKYNIEINFFNIQDFIPEFSYNSVIPTSKFKCFPRIIKSHNEVNTYFNKVLLLIRDPRDVMVSYYFYLRGLKQIPKSWTFSQIIEHYKYGIDAWVKHTKGWLERANKGKRVQCFLYENFLKNPQLELKKIFALLGYHLEDNIIEEAVRRSSKKRMKELELQTRSPKILLEENNFRFVRKGESGGGKELKESELNLIYEKAKSIMELIGYKTYITK
ncbi:Sulfotransferase domain-containing protein [Candidatus Magnetomoraceae bacterium gMMP-15]